MKFVEVDLFGVHVAPISPMSVAARLVAMGMTADLEGGRGS
jgi:hypothetical protein